MSWQGDSDRRRASELWELEDEEPRRPRLAPGKRSLTSQLRIVQRKESAAAPSADDVDVPTAGGEPLPDDLRVELEGALGTDLGAVRIHTGEDANQAAAGLSARAFTAGHHISFAPGEYDPATEEGRELVAHEVAHTVQQGEMPAEPQTKLRVSSPGDALEREADDFATAFVMGFASRPDVSANAASGMVHRKPDGEPEQTEARAEDLFARRGVQVTFKGVSILELARASGSAFAAEELPDLTTLLHMRVRFLELEQQYAGAALASVSHLPEMRFMQRGSDKKRGDYMELPASYLKAPPTPEMLLFLSAWGARTLVDFWIELKSEDQDENEQQRIEDIAGVGQQGTEADLHALKTQMYVNKMLQALTGTFGGLLGLAIGQLVSDDPMFIADMGVTGEMITSTFGEMARRRRGKEDEKKERGRRPKRKRRINRRRRRLGAGRKGAWNKELNNPKPLHEYVIADTNYSYSTDKAGNTVKVRARVQVGSGYRNEYQQRKAGGKDRLSGDQGGHLLAKIFRGPGEAVNIVAMGRELNLSGFKRLENAIARALEAGKPVSITLRVSYPSGSRRPNKITGSYTIDGERTDFRFSNRGSDGDRH